jgi:hypothetical protein
MRHGYFVGLGPDLELQVVAGTREEKGGSGGGGATI